MLRTNADLMLMFNRRNVGFASLFFIVKLSGLRVYHYALQYLFIVRYLNEACWTLNNHRGPFYERLFL